MLFWCTDPNQFRSNPPILGNDYNSGGCLFVQRQAPLVGLIIFIGDYIIVPKALIVLPPALHRVSEWGAREKERAPLAGQLIAIFGSTEAQ